MAIYPVITIDGPSGTGKGTISFMLAKALGWHFLDSGALYRVLALAARLHAVDVGNERALEVLAAHLDVQFVAARQDPSSKIILEGTEVTDAIRQESVGTDASLVSQYSSVRKALLERQRAFRTEPGLVTDGRDMGTIVFPDAPLKLFLDADVEERAQRRFRQLKEKGINANLARVREELIERDMRDRQRSVAPLRPAEDAVIIDTTRESISQVYALVMLEVEKHREILQLSS